jgi:hypothetical protein
MGMLENIPSVNEMIAALNSPTVPTKSAGSPKATAMKLSTDDMIKEIFNMLNEQKYAAGQSSAGGCDNGIC